MRYTIEGLNCAHCANKIEQEIRRLPGLGQVVLNFATKSVTFQEVHETRVQGIIDRLEPGAKLVRDIQRKDKEILVEQGPSQWKIWMPLIAAGALLLLGLMFQSLLKLQWMSWGKYPVFLGSFLLVGWPVLRRAAQNLLRGAVMDEHFLMSVASLGAIGIGELPEAAAVMVFYSVGERLQEMAVGKSRRSIAALLNVRPDTAHTMRDGIMITVHPDQVRVGEIIVIRPGERVPLDGEVVEGSSFLDTAPLTGESVPRRAVRGDSVLAGSINLQGVLEVRATRVFGESSVARILELVERAGERKAPAEKFITSFSRYYTPAVVAAAVMIAFIPPLVIPGATFSEWIYRALVLLVISCPCALVVSVPLTYFAGIGAASRQGVLFKGANFIDSLAKADTVVFDKTGTLTKGVFKVVEILPATGFSKEALLRTAALAEQHSLHPIAMSIKSAFATSDTNYDNNNISIDNFEEIPGYGIKVHLDGKAVLAGNDRLLTQNNIEHPVVSNGGTVVHVSVDSKYMGTLVVSDELRTDALQTINRLKELGIRQVVMLTGDKDDVAASTSQTLGLDAWHANLLPEDKVNKLADVSRGKKAIFVGDGINDAPVIASADVGVAMGGLGSDAAIEAADVVLIDAKPSRLITALEVARNTTGIARQNIALSLGVKGVFLVMGAIGVASVWWAVFADVGVTFLAVLNALRALRLKETAPMSPQEKMTGNMNVGA